MCLLQDERLRKSNEGESVGSLALYFGLILRHLGIGGVEMNKYNNKTLFCFLRCQQMKKCLHMNYYRHNISKFEWKSGQTIWIKEGVQFSSVQSLSHVGLFATPWIIACQASLSITNSRSSLKLMSIESVMPSNHLILSSPSPPAPNPSQHQGLFQWVNFSHEVAEVLEFQLQHHSFQWTPRTDLL